MHRRCLAEKLDIGLDLSDGINARQYLFGSVAKRLEVRTKNGQDVVNAGVSVRIMHGQRPVGGKANMQERGQQPPRERHAVTAHIRFGRRGQRLQPLRQGDGQRFKLCIGQRHLVVFKLIELFDVASVSPQQVGQFRQFLCCLSARRRLQPGDRSGQRVLRRGNGSACFAGAAYVVDINQTQQHKRAIIDLVGGGHHGVALRRTIEGCANRAEG